MDRKSERLPGLHVVPHTHWDREWYATSATYRARLIKLVDGLMQLLEEHPEFASFTFDGQVAPIDDYLNALPEAIRAQQEARLRSLIRSGRIIIGPWYTLSDQFLVSGETTLRNLEMGIARAQELGAVMEIAYCPDQFGLMAELPKVLRQVGIARAIGDRGIRRDFPERFIWRSLDGSEVELLNLKEGYNHPHQGSLALRWAAHRKHGEPVLFMAGFDHSVPDASLARRAEDAGGRISSLPRYWDALPPLQSPFIYTGELRSQGRRNLLPNVISNRVDQRLEVAAAERMLERYAEPLAALFSAVYPTTLLNECWRNQIWNAAHDSACATGIDEVTRQVRVRAREVGDTASGIADDALGQLAAQLRVQGDYVWNPSNFARDFHLPGRVPGILLAARDVPPLGWARLKPELVRPLSESPARPEIRFTDEAEHGDTYTFEPRVGNRVEAVNLPYEVHRNPGEPFTRLRVAWKNTAENHRLRLIIKLPQAADGTVADTPFGIVTRPGKPRGPRGRDRLNGYPAGKFIVAGGMAILLDRVAEYELLPETNELAITLLRSHDRLARFLLRNRLGAAGPRLATQETQLLGEISWDIAVMPWSGRQRMPWQQWEEFMLPPLRFRSQGRGTLPERGTLFANSTPGVLSAVLPDRVRLFQPDSGYRIVEEPLLRQRTIAAGERSLAS